MGTDHHQHRATMFTLAILTILASLAASAPQSRIIPEANTYGTQVIGTGQTQGSQTIQYGYDNALAGLNFLNSGLQSTNTFGVHRAQRADCRRQHGNLWVQCRSLWPSGTQLWTRTWPTVLLGLGLRARL